jgi:hypothetical protein
MLKSVFHPISDEAKEYGSEIDGWYDIGMASPEEVARFQAWYEEANGQR